MLVMKFDEIMKLWFLKKREEREGGKRKGSPTLILKFCWLKVTKGKALDATLFPQPITCVGSKFKVQTSVGHMVFCEEAMFLVTHTYGIK
jgi:hypothetical protein